MAKCNFLRFACAHAQPARLSPAGLRARPAEQNEVAKTPEDPISNQIRGMVILALPDVNTDFRDDPKCTAMESVIHKF